VVDVNDAEKLDKWNDVLRNIDFARCSVCFRQRLFDCRLSDSEFFFPLKGLSATADLIDCSEIIIEVDHAGSSLADFSTLKMEAIRSSETSVHTRSTRRHIPEDGILHS
jgi:hypothetical protein